MCHAAAIQSGGLGVSDACMRLAHRRVKCSAAARPQARRARGPAVQAPRQTNNHRLPAEFRTLALSIVRADTSISARPPAFAGTGSGGRASRLLSVASTKCR